MSIFEHTFTVGAPRDVVAEFHGDTNVLKRLTPPPLFVTLHRVDRLEEDAVADFTMWFGPIPVRWRAVHHDVDEKGFTDVQIRGPLRNWRHTHRFIALDENSTRVDDRVIFKHHAGLRGWVTRLLFNRVSLKFLFAYRRTITRRALSHPDRDRSPLTTALLGVGAAALSLLLFWRLFQKAAIRMDPEASGQ